MAFLKRFFPYLMRASIKGPTLLAPVERSCHAACGGKRRANGLIGRPVNGGVVNLEHFNKECRLQMIVHFADKWTAAVDEEGRK